MELTVTAGIIAGLFFAAGIIQTIHTRRKYKNLRGMLLRFMEIILRESGYSTRPEWLAARFSALLKNPAVNPDDFIYYGPRFDLKLLYVEAVEIETRESKLERLTAAVKSQYGGDGYNWSYSSEALGDSFIVNMVEPQSRRVYQIDSPESQGLVVAGEVVMGLFIADNDKLISFTSAADKDYYANLQQLSLRGA